MKTQISFRGPMSDGKYRGVFHLNGKDDVVRDMQGNESQFDTAHEATAMAGHVLCARINKADQ